METVQTLSTLESRRVLVREMKSRASDVVFCMKLAIYLSIITAATVVLVHGGVLLSIPATVVLGVMFAHGVELQHQVLHGQGFRNRKLNDCVGVMLGLPMLVSYAGYQVSHLRHHRDLGTPQNKEFFDYGDQYGLSPFATVGLWAKRLLMPAHYVSFFKNLGRALVNQPMQGEAADVSERMRRDYLAMLVAITALTALSMVLHTPYVLVLWLLPLLLVAGPAHALIEMPEHYQCDVNSTDACRNTRTIQSNGFMYWLTNGNNFHVEHHMMPALPIDRLHDLHPTIEGKIIHLYPTYRAFYRDVLLNKVAPVPADGV